jgi:hypothetical protein
MDWVLGQKCVFDSAQLENNLNVLYIDFCDLSDDENCCVGVMYSGE